jgi:signal transduction histidine kinase
LPDSDADGKFILGELHRYAQGMLTMVNDLLDVAKIESGDLELHLAAVDLVELIEHALRLNRLGAEKKSISIECVYEKPSIPIVVDPGKIEQVLANLLSNAIKYSPPGSSVSLSARRSETDVLVSVQDHGPGISAEGQARLFQPFGRVGSKPTAGEKSTGLGLAICRKIVEGHKGSIWVESSPGQGSTFFFSLPVTVSEPFI